MSGEKRIEWADIARGIGIILVAFAHTLVPRLRGSSAILSFIWIFIYNFHMPLFFFVSGWLFERNLSRYGNKAKFIKGKLQLLMLPYLTFSIIAYVFVYLAMKIPALAGVLSGGGYGAAGVKDTALGILFYQNHTDRHLWFVYSLFIVFLINIVIPKLMKSKPMLIVLLALYVSKAFVHYPAILDYTASDLLFFSLARVMLADNRTVIAPTLLKAAAWAAVFVCGNIVYSYFYVNGMPQGAVKTVLYVIRAACSVSGIITVCTASDYISRTRLCGFFTELGQYSYDIYLIHAPFLVSGLMGVLLAYSPFPEALCCAAVCVIGILLPYIISRFIIRKLPVLSVPLLGRNFVVQYYSEGMMN